jgi:glycosyltransferase involved in cell wall biosynthesis
MKNLPAPCSSVIHNGIDVERFNNCFSSQQVSSTRKSLGFEDSDFIVGICASLRPEKAHSDLLDALAYLKKRGYRFKCMIIGDGPEREKIARAVELRDLQSDVAFTGFIADVRIYIAACDVMTLVSHYVETFSLSALEAMSMGKPMIMSDVGGASEQVIPGYNGALFPAGDIQALARSILETKYANADGAMGANARDSVVKRFSRERMVSMFEREFLTMVRYP